MQKPHPEKGRNTVAFLLAQVGARSAQEFARLLAPLNFTPPDAGILHLLSQSPGISQQDLAGRLGMHASRLVALIDSMEERGLVARKASPNDRRIYALQLSEAGKEALVAVGRIAREHEEVMCAGLNATERSQLTQLLGKIAVEHGLAPGIHPGYRNLGERKSQPCES